MKKAHVFIHDKEAGILEELEDHHYQFTYHNDYQGPPVSLTMPTKNQTYNFNTFPAFFDGLLPEGAMLEALLRAYKLDKRDYLGQLLKVGDDLVGAVKVEEFK